MYSSTFSDWFSQAVIDFMLGFRSISVFGEFLHNLSSVEPGELLRISKIRSSAIETCTSMVLSEGEQLQYGWTLLSPEELNTKISDSFEEKVLLLVGGKLSVYFTSLI
jgi:phosphatidylinositol 4-phosphatase